MSATPSGRSSPTAGRCRSCAETEPAWLGYSVGRWDGDTFVVESIGFRDKGWLSANMAYPNSEALKVTERFRRIDFGHLEETVTIDDPKAYEKPWTNTIILTLQADTELLDSYCDNQLIMQSHYAHGSSAGGALRSRPCQLPIVERIARCAV